MPSSPSLKPPRAAGYSGTPLVKKLGVKEGCRILLLDAPPEYPVLLQTMPPGVSFVEKATSNTDLAHMFVTDRSKLAKYLSALRKTLRPDATIWVSWPKKSSKVPSQVTEDTVREIALPLGLVDVKVCAISEVWSGLKLVVRRELR
jgi:hypothetical protein